MYLYVHLLVVFLNMNHQYIFVNHLKLFHDVYQWNYGVSTEEHQMGGMRIIHIKCWGFEGSVYNFGSGSRGKPQCTSQDIQ